MENRYDDLLKQNIELKQELEKYRKYLDECLNVINQLPNRKIPNRDFYSYDLASMIEKLK